MASTSPYRVAIALTNDNEADLVALARLAVATDGRFQLVVPALDAAAAERRVGELLDADRRTVHVESVHDYLERGHDLVALMSDDPTERGRSLALVARLLLGGEAPTSTPLCSPSEVVVWLAERQSMRVPDALSPQTERGRGTVETLGDGRVLLRTRWGTNLIALSGSLPSGGLVFDGLYNPSVASALDHLLRPGDTAVDASAGIGGTAVQMARRVGPLGRVAAVECDREQYELLLENVSINGVRDWTDTVYDDGSGEVLADLFAPDRPIALVRSDGVLRTLDVLERAADAIAAGMVRRLLVRLEPPELRPDHDAVDAILRDYRRRYGAAFSFVDTGGSLSTATVDQVTGDGGRWTVVQLVEPPEERGC